MYDIMNSIEGNWCPTKLFYEEFRDWIKGKPNDSKFIHPETKATFKTKFWYWVEGRGLVKCDYDASDRGWELIW